MMTMNLNEIHKLIANGETEAIEYKKSLAELDKLGKALCGQLNTQGGYGFIGITDSDKKVIAFTCKKSQNDGPYTFKGNPT